MDNTYKWTQKIFAILLIILCFILVMDFPLANFWLIAGLIVYFITLLFYPSIWLIILPAVLPILDITYLSGRFFFNEYDILVVATIASGFWHHFPWLKFIGKQLLWMLLLLLFIQIAVTLNGFFPIVWLEDITHFDYFSPYNALREFKGILWAILLVPMMAGAIGQKINVAKLFSIGMVFGLLFAISTILWERILFTGLFNFSHTYRVSGWFSSMHTGGAAIDAYLILAAPFIISIFVYWKSIPIRLFGVFIGFLLLYSFYVTYSRADYPAIIGTTLVFIIGLYFSEHKFTIKTQTAPKFIAIFSLILVSILVAISGKNIQTRFSTTYTDLLTRFNHWNDSINVMSDSSYSSWLGEGKGTFPRMYFWEHQLRGDHHALAQLVTEDNNLFIRFSQSDKEGNLFLRQRFDSSHKAPYHLQIKLRSPQGNKERLLIEFCERHILSFQKECKWKGINIPKGETGWKIFNLKFNVKYLGREQHGLFHRPVDISIINRGIKKGLDIASVQITSANGIQLLSNQDFSQGWDHWFLSYGNHLRWHIKNVFVFIFFESGFLGVLAFILFGSYISLWLIRSILKGNYFSLISLASLTGVIIVGLFDSLFDDPRISQLIIMIAFSSMLISRYDSIHHGKKNY